MLNGLKKLVPFTLFSVLLLSLAGCGPWQNREQYYKEDADREVYDIIENKWQDEFGSRANYKLADPIISGNDVREVTSQPTALTLADAVTIATVHSSDYQSQKELLYLETLDLTLVRHEFRPRFFGLLNGGYTRDADDESASLSAELGFNQVLADGAVISASIASSWLRFLTGDPGTTLGSILSATITQPLLRGSGRKIVQENLTQAERDVLYRIREFNRFRKKFVVTVLSRYYDSLQLVDEVNNQKNNYEARKKSEDRIRMLAQAGRAPKFEVGEAQQSTFTAVDDYVKAQESYKQSLDDFKILLGVPMGMDIALDEGELDTLRNAGISDPNYTVADAIETALTQRLDLANSQDRIADAERKLMVAADGLGPELNLIGSADVASQGNSRFVRFQFHEGTYSLGFEFDPDLDRKAERNAYALALINLQKYQREYALFLNQVKLEVRKAFRDLRKAAARYEIQQKSLGLAQQRVDNQELLLEAGRATTRNLIDAQDDLLAAQNKRTAELIAHTKAKLQFFRDVGILQVRPDGFWEQRRQ